MRVDYCDAAYQLYLERTLRNATLITVEGQQTAVDRFISGGFDALAGLRPALLAVAKDTSTVRILPGHFTTVQQAVGIPRTKAAQCQVWLTAWIEARKADGTIQQLVERFDQQQTLIVAQHASL